MPLFLTAYLTWALIMWIDSWVKPLIPVRWNPETYLPFAIPGIGVVVAVFGLTVLGFLTANLVGRTVVSTGEAMLGRTPIIVINKTLGKNHSGEIVFRPMERIVATVPDICHTPMSIPINAPAAQKANAKSPRPHAGATFSENWEVSNQGRKNTSAPETSRPTYAPALSTRGLRVEVLPGVAS